jgi:hypothetical protein
VCDIAESRLSITLSTEPFSSDECLVGAIDGWIDGTLTEEDDAVELVLSTCPPSADCDTARLCRIRIEGSGVPLYPALLRHEYDYLEGWVDESYVRLSRVVDCCGGADPDCFCGPHHVLYARNGNPDASPPDPVPDVAEQLVFRRADGICDEGPSACGDRPFFLEASLTPSRTSVPTAPAPIVVAPGETRRLGDTGLAVHLISSRRDACTDEPGSASWVAWLAEVPADGDDVGPPTGP